MLHIMSPSSSGDRHNPRTGFLGGRGFGVRYPSPFFDVAQQSLPENVHQLHLWCRYYFLTNPIINVACQKMAEYPVTPVIWETEDKELRHLYESLEEHLSLQQFQVEVGLDYFVYGNAFVSVMFPLEKYLVCRGCQARYRASKNRSLYRWRDGRFFLRCPKCGKDEYAQQSDVYVRNARGARLLRWNPENVEVKHSEITGTTRYYYRLPQGVLNDIRLGDPDAIEGLPQQFLEAARTKRALVFNGDNFWHLKRPTIAQKDQGWGTPLVYPLLKDAFYMQIMKKAQESLLLEHVVPLRIIYPGPSTGGNDSPFGSYNLQNWKSKIDSELQNWKVDHNYIPILPVNVGFQQVGGTARALILHQEFRILAEHMLAGAGIPVEFVFGGLQWSSSNTSLRALENTFLGYNRQRLGLVRFVLRRIASHMGWPWCPFRFDRFKMADDLQRSMFMFQLNQANKISDRSLLEDIGKDADVERGRIEEELRKTQDTQRKLQVASADAQGAAMVRQSHYQARAQKLMLVAEAEAAGAGAEVGASQGRQGPGGDATDQVAGMPEGATAYEENADSPNQHNAPTAVQGMQSQLRQGQGVGVDLGYMAQRAAGYLRSVRKESGDQAMYSEMETMQVRNPQLYSLVVQMMNDSGSQQDPTNAMTSPVTGQGRRDSSRVV